MSKVIPSALILVLLLTTTQAQVVYVDADATGADDGSNWVDAFDDLQAGLDVATAGTQVWIAAGTYFPSVLVGGAEHRFATFLVPSDVELRGGFAGGELSVAQADPALHTTTLSGDFGTVGEPSTNAYHVVTLESAGPGTLLDGLTITGGNADAGAFVTNGTRGGGVLMTASSLTLSRCTVSANLAGIGGGLHCDARGNSIVIDRCTFEDNQGGGGVLFNNDGGSESTTTVLDSVFVGNTRSGLLISTRMNAVIERCHFEDNTYASSGGALGLS